MENISEALYIAGAVLMLVIALTVGMSSFSTIRAQIDEIIESDAKVDLAVDESGNYINYIISTDKSDVRTVGAETIVSSMYRVLKENYNLYIKLKSGYESLDTITVTDEVMYKDAEGNEQNLINNGEQLLEISLTGKINSAQDIDKLLGDDGLYAKLQGKKFKEYLGVYQEETDDTVSELNKATFRVITYIEQ